MGSHVRGRWPRRLPAILGLALLFATAPVTAPGPVHSLLQPLAPWVTPPMLTFSQAQAARLQCVPFARNESRIKIRGNAWTWWRQAHGDYRRGARPAPGAVMVMSKSRRLNYGHVAVVRAIMSSREILVDHANWLNRGRVHRNSRVRDVSPNNDWSVVQVWYDPGNVWGKNHYPLSGFIYAPQSPLPNDATRFVNVPERRPPGPVPSRVQTGFPPLPARKPAVFRGHEATLLIDGDGVEPVPQTQSSLARPAAVSQQAYAGALPARRVLPPASHSGSVVISGAGVR